MKIAALKILFNDAQVAQHLLNFTKQLYALQLTVLAFGKWFKFMCDIEEK